MAVRLPGARRSAEQIAANDRHHGWDVVLVVVVLLVYCWCYTHLAAWLGVATPVDVVNALGLDLPRVIDDDGNFDSKLHVSFLRTRVDDGRLVVFAALLGCFLTTYFSPLRHKAKAAVLWFMPAFALLYGGTAALQLIAGHLTIWLVFHASNPRSGAVAAVLGGVVAWLVLGAPALWHVPVLAVAGGLAWLGFRAARPVFVGDGAAARWIRGVLVQSCMLVIAALCVRSGVTGEVWRLPMGLLFFLFQWARLMVYHADFRDGQVPRDLAVSEYLQLFLTPVTIANVGYAPYLGQGYAYLQGRWLTQEKRALVRSGVRLWCLALVYMLFAEQVIAWFIAGVDRVFGVRVFAFTSELVREHLSGRRVSTPTVLLSTLVDQARIFLIYGGVTHFRVGAWRVMGYAVDTQYDRPWLATNLASLWGRFAFHFREFLVRVFYYPVFLKVFRRRPLLRIFFATMVATVVGNLVWGHVPPKTITAPKWEHLALILSTWPYFVLLGLGISLTQMWLASRPRTRRPWTRDRLLVLDVVCAYLTLQYFALIHVFIRPQPGGTLMDYVRLVLIGVGIG